MAKEYDISKISFLIIDDNRYMRRIVNSALKGFGVSKLFEASDAAEGFELFRTQMIDIIIVDYKMPTLDGVEFVQLVRTARDSPNPYVPIIMLSAYTNRATVEHARDAGITEFLSKPISAKSLFLYIVATLEHPRNFIRSPGYFGPDRRRKDDTAYKGPERRKSAPSL
ncbi:MAG: two-component system response regulator [Hyphomicrobiales bacterium]|nr:MAG: two-component system response regulator [Hyphomicrobiales bacterium]